MTNRKKIQNEPQKVPFITTMKRPDKNNGKNDVILIDVILNGVTLIDVILMYA